MKDYAVGAGVLVALVVLFAAATGGAVAEVQDENEQGNNETFGADVSSFMQASTAEAEAEVDEGMFQAAMRRASQDEKQQLVEQRQARLAARQAKLQDRREELSTNEPAPKNQAVATRVQVGAEELEHSVASTQEQATRVGVDGAQLNELRDQARTLKDDVSKWAREMAENAGGANDRSSSWDGDRPGGDRGNGADRNSNDRDNGSVDVSDGKFGGSENSNESDEE